MIPMLKGLAFVLAFFVSIHVRSEVLNLPLEAEVVQEPENCLDNHVYPCAVKTHADRKFRVRFGRHEVVLGSNSACQLEEDSQIRLLQGEFLVFTQSAMQIQVPSGTLKMDGESLALLNYSDSKTVIRPLQGSVHVAPLVAEDEFDVLAGQENWLGKVRPDGHVAAGLPMTSSYKTELTNWARLTYLKRDEFKEAVQNYRGIWEVQRDRTADLLRETVQENVATIEAQERARKAAQEKAKLERQQLRKMLWEDAFGVARAEQPARRAPASEKSGEKRRLKKQVPATWMQ